MGGTKSTPEATGRKRKQEVEDGATPLNQKRMRKDVPTPKTSTQALKQTTVAATPNSAQGSAKGTKKQNSAVKDTGQASKPNTKVSGSPQQATSGVAKEAGKSKDVQASGSAGEQPTKLSQKEKKRLRKERDRQQNGTPPVGNKPQAMDADGAVATSPPAGETISDEAKVRRAAAKKARRQSLHKEAPTPHSAIKAKASRKSQLPDAVATPIKAKKTVSKTPSKLAELKEEPHAKWTLSAPTAGRYIEHDPVFVNDANGDEHLVAATSHEVQILSLETSLPVRSLQTMNDAAVVSFTQEPRSSIISFMDDQETMTFWDWENDSVKRYQLPKSGSLQAYAAREQAVGEDESRTVRVFVTATFKKSSNMFVGDEAVYKTELTIHSLHATADAHFVIAYGPGAVVLGRRKKNATAATDYDWVELPMATEVTCAHAALRQTNAAPGLRLAVGHADGQIHLYEDVSRLFDIKDASKLHSPRVLHWHRDSVSSVKFSADGRYLVSGGKETVLVIWQLETGHKQYLPHLTSEIESVVVNSQGDRYAVQMGDNSIMVLSTSELKPVANFAGLQMPVPVRRDRKGNSGAVEVQSTTAALHPTQPDQLLLTVPSTQPKSEMDIAARPFLQSFDLRASRHSGRQALTRNNVTDFNLGPERTPIIPPDVAHVAISHDGQWLATVDEWVPPVSDVEFLVPDGVQIEEEQLRRKEVYLKLWQWDVHQAIWTLTTRVDAPHARAFEEASGAGSVFALAANPSSIGFATIGEDTTVKTWKPRTRMRHGVPMKDEQGNELVEWTCRRSTELEKQLARIDSPLEDDEGVEAAVEGPTDARLAFSDDGSTLAAAVTYDFVDEEPVAHLIDVATGEVKHCKDNWLAADLAGIGFLDRYLIALSRETLRVWDVVADKMQYQIDLPVLGDDDDQPTLAVNTRERTFAVGMPKPGKGRSTVEVYEPQRAEALHKANLPLPLSALLTGKSTRGYTLVLANATVRTLALTGAVRKAGERGSVATASASAEPTTVMPAPAPATAVPDLLLAGRDSTQGLVLEETEDDRPVVRPEQLASVFDVGQGVALPSVREMFRSVADLYSRKPTRSGADPMDIDV